ncbi:Type-1 restriction enzyme EcoKI specificity protein [Methanosarcinales archaeon]|nr:Type-1 restriction enzyme EcoKI specificity protein [Methanosarcinales archaeon]
MSFPMVALGELLMPVSRPESVDAEKEYRILGAHWYAEGLYIKHIKLGSEIQANKVYRIEKGDFVYNRLFAWKGSFAVATNENHGCYVSNEFPCFKVDSDRADSKYLWLYFSRAKIWEEALGLSTGGTPTSRNRLKEEKFLAMQISLPPLAEQRRIVAHIEELAAKIEEARGLRKMAGEETEALISLTTSAKCYGNGQTMCAFGDVLLEAKNGIYKPPEYWGFGIPCVRMYNIEGPAMNTNRLQMLDVTPAEIEIYSCKAGDLIFNRVNSAELVGKTGLITENYPKCTFESKNMRLRIDLKKVISEYAAKILNSKETREYYRQALKQQCGMATLNQGHVHSIPFPLPPLPEQRRIIAYLDELQAKVDALRRLHGETGAELDALLPAILDRAFKGEL